LNYQDFLLIINTGVAWIYLSYV